MSDVPADIEAEEAVVASCLVDPGVIPEVSHKVSPADFFREKNGWIFEAILDVWAKGEDAVNTISVAKLLAERGTLEEVGGQTELNVYIRRLPTSVGAEWYAESVRNTARARRAMQLLHNITQEIRKSPGEVDTVVDRAIEKLLAQNSDSPRTLTRTLAEVLKDGLTDEIEAFLERPEAIRGIATGLEVFDVLLNGLRKGAVIVVMADTSLGKSLLAHNLMRVLALAGVSSLLFTSEMPAREVAERIVFQEARVDPLERRMGGLKPMDREKVYGAIGTITESAAPVYVCDMGGIPILTLQAEARRVVRTRGAQVVLIDHIQHIRAPGTVNGAARMAEVTSGIKALALSEDVPVIAVSHINRDSQVSGITHRSGKDGSSIEQDADVVIAMEAMVQNGAEWLVATKEQADAHLVKWGWVAVRMRVTKGRAGGTGMVWTKLDWRHEGGRYLPWD